MMLKSVRIMLAIAAFYDYEIWQMDVKTAFLNGYLKEELYMMQPEGFVDPKGANKVCKLQRSIYGLLPASQSWNICFDSVIKAYGFIHTFGEACIYKKVSRSRYVSNVSIIFDCSMLLYYLFWMFMGFTLHFYIIFGTNLLTGGPVLIAVFFFLFQCFAEGISNGVQTR